MHEVLENHSIFLLTAAALNTINIFPRHFFSQSLALTSKRTTHFSHAIQLLNLE